MRQVAGVVVGRFQVPELHAGHRHILDRVRAEHSRLIIVIGDHGNEPSHKNPLSFELRKAMLEEAYPDAEVVPLPDHPSDDVWSRMLDALVEGRAPDGAILYGSRDSFLSVYSGSYQTAYIEPVQSPSGTDVRTSAESDVVHHPHFRRGIIHAISRAKPAKTTIFRWWPF